MEVPFLTVDFFCFLFLSVLFIGLLLFAVLVVDGCAYLYFFMMCVCSGVYLFYHARSELLKYPGCARCSTKTAGAVLVLAQSSGAVWPGF